jgi:hypothetical protein
VIDEMSAATTTSRHNSRKNDWRTKNEDLKIAELRNVERLLRETKRREKERKRRGEKWEI